MATEGNKKLLATFTMDIHYKQLFGAKQLSLWIYTISNFLGRLSVIDMAQAKFLVAAAIVSHIISRGKRRRLTEKYGLGNG